MRCSLIFFCKSLTCRCRSRHIGQRAANAVEQSRVALRLAKTHFQTSFIRSLSKTSRARSDVAEAIGCRDENAWSDFTGLPDKERIEEFVQANSSCLFAFARHSPTIRTHQETRGTERVATSRRTLARPVFTNYFLWNDYL